MSWLEQLKNLWKILVLTLLPASLWAATITGTVRDSTSNAAIANALVRVTVTGTQDTVRTNAQGIYTLTNANIVAGTYTVNFCATGYTTRNITGVTVASATSSTTLNVRLLATTTTAGTITGTVRDSTTNAVIAGARVIVNRGGTFADTATTNAQGVYTITNANLTTGNVTVNVSATGYTTRNLTGIAITSGTTMTLNVRLLATVAVARTITGTIRDSATTNPIANVLVTVTVGGVTDSARTNATGLYTISNTNLVAGTYTVTATATGHVTGTASLTITGANTTYSLNFNLRSTTALFSVNAGSKGIRFVQSGDRLTLEFGVSNVTRSLTVYGMNGKVQQNVSVPAGQSHVELSAAFAPRNGFLFQVK